MASFGGGLLMQTTIVVYNFSVYALGDLRWTFLEKISENVQKFGLRNVHRQWLEIQSATSKFEKLFSFYPFLLFTNLFIKSCIYLVQLKTMSFEFDVPMVINYIWFVSEYIFTLSMVQVIDHVNKKLEDAHLKYKKNPISSEMIGYSYL